MIPFIIDAVNAKSKLPTTERGMSLNYLEGFDTRDNTYYQQSFWELTDKEIQEIIETKTIVLNLFGSEDPPISMSVLPLVDSVEVKQFLKHNEIAAKCS